MTDTALRAFDGAVAIVTGGASGIGRALGEELVRRGAHAVLADRQVERAREVADRIHDATAAELDVRDFAAFEGLVERTLAEHGRLDYLFNNAGVVVVGEAAISGIDDWNQVLDTNLRGIVHGVQAAYPTMVEQGFGHLVNTASMAGLLALPGAVSYAAAKHAVVGLTKSLRIEAQEHGVRVSALCPGLVKTPILDGGRYGKMLRPIPEEVRTHLTERLRGIAPEDFARRALDAVRRNRAIVVVPGWWRLLWWLERLSPALSLYSGRKFYEAARKAVEAASARSSRG
jgi:NAD(P)-dependent dehydrogenase (short-subunit alcohol dehydrogenase family)